MASSSFRTSRAWGGPATGIRSIPVGSTASSRDCEPALVVGHSLGAGIALQLAARHPGKVRGLVLVSPFFLGRAAPAWQRSTWLVNAMLALSRRERVAPMLHPDGMGHPAVTSALALLGRHNAKAALARAISAAANPRWRRDLATLLGAVSAPAPGGRKTPASTSSSCAPLPSPQRPLGRGMDLTLRPLRQSVKAAA